MVNIEYANAYTEIIEIIKYIPRRDYKKIPPKMVLLFEKNSNKKYKFMYNPEISLTKQNVSKRARTIIAILFRDYWATEKQKDAILKVEKRDRIKIEEEKGEYKKEDLFKPKEATEPVQLIEYKETIFKKIIIKIKRFFKIL